MKRSHPQPKARPRSGKVEALVVPQELRADPYSYYAHLRATDPVHRSPAGFWILTRYRDAEKVLRDDRFGPVARRPEVALDPEVWPAGRGWLQELADRCRRSQEVRAATVGLAKLWMNNLDPPQHTVLRGSVNRFFTASAVERWRPRIREISTRLLDRMADASRVDLMARLAVPLPALVICDLLGAPEADRDRLLSWSRALAPALAGDSHPRTLARASAATLALAAYFDRWVKDRGRDRSEILQGLVSGVAGARPGARDAVAQCLLLLFAGHETTTNLIGNGLLALLRHEDQLVRLKGGLPGAVSRAIEELLRYDSPVQFVLRVARRDVRLGGRLVAAGEHLVVCVAAANRDPEKFPFPDRLDLDRRPNPHLAFGTGIHRCLGAALARVEGEIALETVLRRFPEMELETREPVWKEGSVLRGPAALWVRTGEHGG